MFLSATSGVALGASSVFSLDELLATNYLVVYDPVVTLRVCETQDISEIIFIGKNRGECKIIHHKIKKKYLMKWSLYLDNYYNINLCARIHA